MSKALLKIITKEDLKVFKKYLSPTSSKKEIVLVCQEIAANYSLRAGEIEYDFNGGDPDIWLDIVEDSNHCFLKTQDGRK